ncbi:MAG: tRNA (guanine-N(1)-)-methyltransferase [Candidatus Magasanikbacteria bacterium GW2011_GWC2_37_14]|uniref:tRNA (guanine-N(1)-)-methyltransferase n=1 Tax=Candidatus Magasanikbacteria bacterium GW2011_GWC2_37_14 TaxID=1619046 RepID=A0A0G0JF57_9BACT|nr:MAG: tRNA (guanine-N(1)-)-methyltransferase [Candidatus Magasanikbacteria bacterium GW2011_GWC2_37_14]
MKFNVITIFPKIISDYCDETILARAQKNNLIKINPVDLRDFTTDNHKTVDDTPYGGGAGMVMKVEPIFKALKSLEAIPFSKADGLSKIKKIFTGEIKKKKKTILLSPRGKQFDERLAEQLAKYQELTFVCGRYEGVDQRVTDYLIDEEISVGPYVLAGGELGALIIIEAVSRLIPGVLGNEESLKEETFGSKLSLREAPKGDEAIPMQKEYAQYTKPDDFNGWKVPDVLLSGNHAEIRKWRKG